VDRVQPRRDWLTCKGIILEPKGAKIKKSTAYIHLKVTMRDSTNARRREKLADDKYSPHTPSMDIILLTFATRPIQTLHGELLLHEIQVR